MAASYQAKGTFAATSSRGSTLTVPWPTHQTNDVALLFASCADDDTISLGTANGFAEITNSPQASGSSGTGTKLHVFWCRASSSSMSSPILAHTATGAMFGGIITYRNCIATGNPWDVTAGSSNNTSATTNSLTSITTTVTNTLIVYGLSANVDATTPFTTSITNANVSSLTERLDEGTNLAKGTEITVWDGDRAATGSIGTATWTGTNARTAWLTIALKSAITGQSFCPGFIY